MEASAQIESTDIRHPSQLSVPEVPTTVPPQLQPYWVKI